MSPRKHIVFDVVGTCVSFDAFYERIAAILGPRLLGHHVSAPHFGYTWKEAAELEFYLILASGRYTAYGAVFRAVFYRTLAMAGIPDPRAFATDAERDACQAAYAELRLRPGCAAMMAGLRAAGWTVWCFTSGDVERVLGYFQREGVEMPRENFVSCDQLTDVDGATGRARPLYKPSLAAYRHVLRLFADEDEKWFAAAHMWDVSAAVQAGFRGAYCSVYEKEPCAEIFGTQMDVMAESLHELAERVTAASST
ncbi:hypothetical protein B2J93_3983 [Marssonina coronariae]|uniref:2-haloalkanoic acid dehalogenase n=1 Tax=Diplocarpon coronariae TaxID=2795749 RepID=A0A218YUI1_9HELO|nr:hypothetical protein B2J93_3983 [Marssonina coronariae]